MMSAQQLEEAEFQQCYARKNREVKRSVRQDKRIYIDEKTEEVESAASRGDSRTLYKITKELSDRTHYTSKPVRPFSRFLKKCSTSKSTRKL